jgi:hypothetical protein
MVVLGAYGCPYDDENYTHPTMNCTIVSVKQVGGRLFKRYGLDLCCGNTTRESLRLCYDESSCPKIWTLSKEDFHGKNWTVYYYKDLKSAYATPIQMEKMNCQYYWTSYFVVLLMVICGIGLSINVCYDYYKSCEFWTRLGHDGVPSVNVNIIKPQLPSIREDLYSTYKILFG